MKKKELKNLARKIAEAEKIIQKNDDLEASKKAQEEVIRIANSITSLEDMMILDELIQEFLN